MGRFFIEDGEMNTRLDFSDKNGIKHHANDNKKLGTIRPLDRGTIVPLDASDPRNPDHPSQKANWLVFARELGASFAAEEWERLYGRQANDEEGSDLCEIFERPAKRCVH